MDVFKSTSSIKSVSRFENETAGMLIQALNLVPAQQPQPQDLQSKKSRAK
jgi:hypothetical protein